MSEEPDAREKDTPRHLRVFDKVPPRLRRPVRIAASLLLVTGGVLGFLPILGFWMIPLGLSILAVDYPPAGRLLDRLSEAARRVWSAIRRGKET